MKLIDSRGRLFGKINIFDLLVFVFICTVIILSYRYFFNSNFLINQDNTQLQVELFIHDVRNVTDNAIKTGDIIKFSENGQIIGEIDANFFAENRLSACYCWRVTVSLIVDLVEPGGGDDWRGW